MALSNRDTLPTIKTNESDAINGFTYEIMYSDNMLCMRVCHVEDLLLWEGTISNPLEKSTTNCSNAFSLTPKILYGILGKALKREQMSGITVDFPTAYKNGETELAVSIIHTVEFDFDEDETLKSTYVILLNPNNANEAERTSRRLNKMSSEMSELKKKVAEIESIVLFFQSDDELSKKNGKFVYDVVEKDIPIKKNGKFVYDVVEKDIPIKKNGKFVYDVVEKDIPIKKKKGIDYIDTRSLYIKYCKKVYGSKYEYTIARNNWNKYSETIINLMKDKYGTLKFMNNNDYLEMDRIVRQISAGKFIILDESNESDESDESEDDES
jgi:hypothetical protein